MLPDFKLHATKHATALLLVLCVIAEISRSRLSELVNGELDYWIVIPSSYDRF